MAEPSVQQLLRGTGTMPLKLSIVTISSATVKEIKTGFFGLFIYPKTDNLPKRAFTRVQQSAKMHVVERQIFKVSKPPVLSTCNSLA